MRVDAVAKLTGGTVVCRGSEDCDPDKVYAGDFLSRVMGKAPAGSIWLTVMTNVNVAAVATLADVKIVVICEGAEPDALLKGKCENENIALIKTALPVYECCKAL